MSNNIIRAFYHMGRRQCVPWTLAELARRTGMNEDKLQSELMSLAQRSIAKGTSRKVTGQATTWELTEAGKVQARAILAAEAIARSV